jgi:hypothetical protein
LVAGIFGSRTTGLISGVMLFRSDICFSFKF